MWRNDLEMSRDRGTGGMAGNGVADDCYEDTERMGECSWEISGKRKGDDGGERR